MFEVAASKELETTEWKTVHLGDPGEAGGGDDEGQAEQFIETESAESEWGEADALGLSAAGRRSEGGDQEDEGRDFASDEFDEDEDLDDDEDDYDEEYDEDYEEQDDFADEDFDEEEEEEEN